MVSVVMRRVSGVEGVAEAEGVREHAEPCEGGIARGVVREEPPAEHVEESDGAREP